MSIKSNLLLILLASTAVNVSIYKMYGHKSSTHAAPEKPPVELVTPTVPTLPPEVKPPPAPVITEPEFVEVKPVTSAYREDSLYADIMNRSRRPFTKADRDTNAHESTHGINADIRNTHPDLTKVNGFYVMHGKGVVIYEPNMKKSAMIPFLPASLSGSRYSTYVAGSPGWENRPLYIFDEWVAYVNGGSVNLEDTKTGRHDGVITDAMSASLEFSIYAVAMAMAVEKHDPEYWKTNKQFKNFLHWHLKRSYDLFMAGYKLKEFKNEKQEKLLESLRTSPDAKEIRAFIEKHFGGIWLK
jgi:hypothetical protein